jgi:hypothetical protein
VWVWGNAVTYGCGGSADLAKGYNIFAAKAAYCRRDAASHDDNHREIFGRVADAARMWALW